MDGSHRVVFRQPGPRIAESGHVILLAIKVEAMLNADTLSALSLWNVLLSQSHLRWIRVESAEGVHVATHIWVQVVLGSLRGISWMTLVSAKCFRIVDIDCRKPV